MSDQTTITHSAPPEQRNGFTRALLFVPHGARWIWCCDECCRMENDGHADGCTNQRKGPTT